MVAAKMPAAVDAGLAMLAKGGNAIDAAVATAFAVGVAEPWMNGLGGGGFMVVWLEQEQRAIAIDYPMISPLAATEDMFPLAPNAAADTALFGWPSVVDNANVMGYRSVAVPGTVAGLALALERYGTLSLGEVMAPAIELAENGIAINWHHTYWIGREQANLAKFPGSAALFLNEAGAAPSTADQTNPARLRFPDLAKTLRQIADNGPRWFYEGEIATTITRHLADYGAPFAANDFSRYRAREYDARAVPYHDATVYLAGGASGGTTLAQMFLMLDRLPLAGLDRDAPEAIHLMTQVFRQAFADRFTYLGDPDFVDVPFEALLDPAYAAQRVAAFATDRLPPTCAGSRERLGVKHQLAASVPEYMRDGSTTHLSVVDAAGNAVSLTQTLLSGWGSRVVVPGTGVLLNNGMMWFDPEPGRPNSVAGGKQMMANMAPVVFRQPDGTVTSLGSSGGRKIMMCNAQLIRNIVDFGNSVQDAIDAPRFDTSTRALVLPNRLDPSAIDRLAALGHTISLRDESLMTGDFASPVGVRRQASDEFDGGADPWYFPATAAALH
jgi:gamma-glutamyltranspeptidase/glutathione hydrolase